MRTSRGEGVYGFVEEGTDAIAEGKAVYRPLRGPTTVWRVCDEDGSSKAQMKAITF